MELVASVRPSVRPYVGVFVRAVDIRGSALPSAANSIGSQYQCKVFVYVSIIIGRMRVISRMRSIGF